MATNGKPKPESADLLANVVFSNPADEQGRVLYPTLFDLLAPRWKDGHQTRQPGRLSIRIDGGAYRVSIECPTEGLQTSMIVASLENLAEAVEIILMQADSHWALTYARAIKNRAVIDDAIQ